MAVDCVTQHQAEHFMNILQNEEQFGYIAVSLGYHDTLMSCSGSSTSSEIPVEEQSAMGLSPGLVRLSVGYTGALQERVRQVTRAVYRAGLVDAKDG